MVTNERTENVVAMAQQPMSDRENRLGWCVGAKVKILSKISWRHRAVSMVLLCIWQNARCFGFKEATSWISVSGVMGTFYIMFLGCFCL